MIFWIWIFFLSGYSFAQNHNKQTKYFDEHYNPITKSEFEKRNSKNEFLVMEGDSVNHKILLIREAHGFVENRKNLYSILSKASGKRIDSIKPLVVIYYPGKDQYNSGGSMTRESTREWYNDLEKGVNKIRTSNIVYVYKNKEGLFGRNDGYKAWIQDPKQIFGTLFFKKYYSGSSFVVISEKGQFISYFGEFPKAFVWKALKSLSK